MTKERAENHLWLPFSFGDMALTATGLQLAVGFSNAWVLEAYDAKNSELASQLSAEFAKHAVEEPVESMDLRLVYLIQHMLSNTANVAGASMTVARVLCQFKDVGSTLHQYVHWNTVYQEKIGNTICECDPVCPGLKSAGDRLLNLPKIVKVLAVVPSLPVTNKGRDVAFGRFKLKVETAASCWEFTDHDLPCEGNPNCTSYVTTGGMEGMGDYDMVPPKSLRHSVRAARPSISCMLTDLVTLNFFMKLFDAAKNGKYAEYYIGIRVTLVDSDLQRVASYHTQWKQDPSLECSDGPTVMWYKTIDGAQYTASDAVHQDVDRYGNILDYSVFPPKLGKVHHLFTGDQIEFWAPQLDLLDVTPSPYDWSAISSSMCKRYVNSRRLVNPCVSVTITYSGAYQNNLALYFLTSDRHCEALVVEAHKVWLANLSHAPLLADFYPASKIQINHQKYALPPAPKLSTDYTDVVTTVAVNAGWFELLGKLIVFIETLVVDGPLPLIQMVERHLIDIGVGLLTWFAGRKLNFRVLGCCIAFWYLKLVQLRQSFQN